jgi:hypothetical protein
MDTPKGVRVEFRCEQALETLKHLPSAFLAATKFAVREALKKGRS